MTQRSLQKRHKAKASRNANKRTLARVSQDFKSNLMLTKSRYCNFQFISTKQIRFFIEKLSLKINLCLAAGDVKLMTALPRSEKLGQPLGSPSFSSLYRFGKALSATKSLPHLQNIIST